MSCFHRILTAKGNTHSLRKRQVRRTILRSASGTDIMPAFLRKWGWLKYRTALSDFYCIRKRHPSQRIKKNILSLCGKSQRSQTDSGINNSFFNFSKHGLPPLRGHGLLLLYGCPSMKKPVYPKLPPRISAPRQNSLPPVYKTGHFWETKYSLTNSGSTKSF